MTELSPTLSVLTAMITPAVLISACSALLLSTSLRLGRTVDRVRDLANEFQTAPPTGDEETAIERRALLSRRDELS
jgi:hypothetical protein